MISILTPSRSRPDLAKRMKISAFNNPGVPIDIKFYLNEDDPMLDDYKQFLTTDQYIVGPNQSTSYSWNLMAERATYDILFLVGDDAQFQTDNWGTLIVQAFNVYPDKIACIYPRVPGMHSSKNPHFCLHKNWVNTLGFFLPPHFYHWYVDTWIRAIASKLNRHVCVHAFEMPIENIRDEVNRTYHNSWQRSRDDWMWDKTERYRAADIAALHKYIQEYK